MYYLVTPTHYINCIASRMAEMEKRRIGTRFLDREVTEDDKEKPLMEKLSEQGCCVM